MKKEIQPTPGSGDIGNTIFPPNMIRVPLLEGPSADGPSTLMAESLQYPPKKRTANLRRIWEPPPNLKCPLVGTCLTDEEVARLLKKAGYRVKGLSPYDLHSRIMACLENENPVSIRIDAYFRRKYQDVLAAAAHLEELEFLRAWREAAASGDLAGLFYVSCLRRDLSAQGLLQIYGEIHMMGHAHTREILRMRGKLASRENTLRAMQSRAREARQRFNEERNASRPLRQELSEAYARITQLSAECKRLKD